MSAGHLNSDLLLVCARHFLLWPIWSVPRFWPLWKSLVQRVVLLRQRPSTIVFCSQRTVHSSKNPTTLPSIHSILLATINLRFALKDFLWLYYLLLIIVGQQSDWRNKMFQEQANLSTTLMTSTLTLQKNLVSISKKGGTYTWNLKN